MKISVVVLLIFILESCNSNDSLTKLKCKNSTGIDNSLYNILLIYQRENPIPITGKYDTRLPPPPETAFRYVYEVQFKKEKDTIVTITLRPDGISFNEKNQINSIFGIYEDTCLKPTYFFDNMNLGREFILKSKRNGLDNYEYDNSSIIDDIYDIYIYKVEKNNFLLLEKIRGSRMR